jgi:DNA-binding NarL/FixJ family response regulator
MSMNPPLESGGGILITEDHLLTASLLARLLAAAFPGYPVSTVATAEEALAMCRAAPPRVVIMDITLPGMNGIEAMRQIKACMPAIQVVMHSNLAADVFIEECMKSGAAAYVVKSSPFAGLIPAVASLLAAQPASDTLQDPRQ